MKTEKLIKSTINAENELKELTVDNINKTKPTEPDFQKKSLEKKYEDEGVKYIKPSRRLSAPMGKLPDKLKKEHKRAWDYVKGIYENFAIPGEALSFSLCLYPGDPDYLWIIPTNIPVAVPRCVAQHLEEVQKYSIFDYRERNSSEMHEDAFTHRFIVSGNKYRGKFRPLEAFA